MGFNLTVSINLSPYCFQNNALLSDLESLLKKTGSLANNITLEVTESAIFHDFTRAQKLIDQLHIAGFQLWLISKSFQWRY